MMRMNVNQGIAAAEALKKRIKETTTNSGLTPPSTTTTTSLLPSPSLVPYADCKSDYWSSYKRILFYFF